MKPLSKSLLFFLSEKKLHSVFLALKRELRKTKAMVPLNNIYNNIIFKLSKTSTILINE